METEVITPLYVESRMLALSKALDDHHENYPKIEKAYTDAKAQFEMALAKSRLKHRSEAVVMREDLALTENEDAYFDLALKEALLKAAKANSERLETQIGLAQSMAKSIQSRMGV